jgi:pullulanase/glycogen debranching enzyme
MTQRKGFPATADISKDHFDWDDKSLKEREAEVKGWKILMDMRKRTSALNADYWWKVCMSAVCIWMIFFIVILYTALEYATR